MLSGRSFVLFKLLISNCLSAARSNFSRGASIMPGRGSQTFQKRQKEQQRKEKQQEKMAKRLAAKNAPATEETSEDEPILNEEAVAADGLPEERPDTDSFGARS